MMRGVWAILVLAVLGTGVWAGPPDVSLRPQYRPGTVLPDGADALLKRYDQPGELGFVVYDLTAGAVIEQRSADDSYAPASVTKAITGLYALSHLGQDFRYTTQVVATGPIVDGTVQGDLILVGGGDPVLDTDDLLDLARGVTSAGVRRVAGRYLYSVGDLPQFRDIDPDQPVHVGYNPAVSGLNLNFNRVYFDWKQSGSGYRVQMDARSNQIQPVVRHISMQVVDRAAPLFSYKQEGQREGWSVAKPALGQKGGRWLPVRDPAHYAAVVFASVARELGVSLPDPIRMTTPLTHAPTDSVVAQVHSAPLRELVKMMLKYSNNMLAETLGLTVAVSQNRPIASLQQSAGYMTQWARENLGMTRAQFDDHSGLNDTSRVSPADMVQALIQGQKKFPDYADVLKPIKPRTASGDLDKSGQARIQAKTGTLHFVTALAGYLQDQQGGQYVFAIFQQDLAARRTADTQKLETPPGSRAWRRRAINIQSGLLYRWARYSLLD